MIALKKSDLHDLKIFQPKTIETKEEIMARLQISKTTAIVAETCKEAGITLKKF